MLSNIVRFLGGDPHKRIIQKLSETAAQINQYEPEFEKLSDEALRAKTDELKARLAQGETLDDLLPEAFAAVREASKRTIGLRHYDVQMIGGMTLHQGRIAEMRTGEGKTLVATLPLYLNALTGRGVHLVTVNDYLARRDARWMAPIYQALGLTVGVLQMAARTDNGRNAFLVDLEKTSAHEDQHQLRTVHRSQAYKADITYGTNSEFGFDYLRDNLTMRLEDRVQRGHYFAIVDEVDNILIDEARTPLIISGPAQDEAEWYYKMAQIVRQLVPEDYEINEKDRTVTLTEAGEAHVEQLLDMPLRDPERPEDITPEQARLLGYLEQALRAQHLYRRNREYLVQGGKVVIVDEFTGRLMPGRRWSEGLHQAVEAKEGVKVEPENITYATITLQNYFRMYDKLSGMTGTAETEAEEFDKIYKLDVLPIPTNLEYSAAQAEAELKPVEGRDDQGYKYTFYARKSDPSRPVYWRRKDFPDVVYRSSEGKLRAITQEILQYYTMGRPQLVGTTSVEHSELLSTRLGAEPIRRLVQVLLIRDAWLRQNKAEMIPANVPELEPLKKPIPEINIGDLRPVARSLGINSMNPEDPENLQALMALLRVDPSDKDRLVRALQAGVPHQVLNARKHDEESIIIAKAGAFGAVTIATNMAGRGVDIKLGGEMLDDLIRDTNHVLGRAEEGDPYEMTIDERYAALKKIPQEEWGIYEESVKAFLQSVEEMRRVRELGGLHVIGSERHEARRIDNQLRGRAARQGDPGSSRFYLSLEDDLMRLFGGQQVENLWKRIMSDESMPLEVGLLGRLVEQSQERVEGSNFDVRKHLLEYDDVLNSQRKRIYGQRDVVFKKEDLSEDVLEMLTSEIQSRIPTALADEEGPWKLLAYLDEVQPSFEFEEVSFPSFSIRLLIDEACRTMSTGQPTAEQVSEALLSISDKALQAEGEHVLRSIRTLLEKTQENYQTQLEERLDLLDTFIEGLDAGSDEETQPARPQDLLTQAADAVRVPFKLNGEQLRGLAEGDRDTAAAMRRQVEDHLTAITINRIIAAVERRLEESLSLRSANLQGKSFEEVADAVLDASERVFTLRAERLLGPKGQIAHDLETSVPRILENDGSSRMTDRKWIQLLSLTTQGTRVSFDARTHRRGQQRYNRLNYTFLAARLLQDAEQEELTGHVQDHLLTGLALLQEARGRMEWQRLHTNNLTLSQLDEKRKARVVEALGLERFEELANLPVDDLNSEDRRQVQETLGKFLQNEVYRELLLRVISDQWVEYLTRVEALRVSIGLEAYAQRDPLVQYKARASEMFTELLDQIRSGVVQHVFTYHLRRAAPAQPAASQPAQAQAGRAAQPAPAQPQPAGQALNARQALNTNQGQQPQPGSPSRAQPQASGGGQKPPAEQPDGGGKRKKRKRR